MPGKPTGLGSSSTFSSYGWNTSVAGTLSVPTPILHGQDDLTAPATIGPGIYDNLQLADRVLVQISCASHAVLYERCSGPRCQPSSGLPYCGAPGRPWAGPHSTVKAALVEWIRDGRFNGASSGRFIVNESGVASPSGP